MTQLYEVVYIGSATESKRELPEPKDDIAYAYAKSASWDDEYLIPVAGEWIMATRAEALMRKKAVQA